MISYPRSSKFGLTIRARSTSWSALARDCRWHWPLLPPWPPSALGRHWPGSVVIS